MPSSLPRQEGEGKVGKRREGRKGSEDHACELMDGFGKLPYAFHNTFASVLHAQIFLLCPLTSLYFLSFTYTSLRLCLIIVESRNHLVIFS